MQKLVFTKKHLVVQLVKFLHVSIDEATIMDCHGWIVVHVYVVEGWKHIPILLTLEQMLSSAIIDNLMKMIMASLLQYGRLYDTNFTSKFISFGADGV
jgi:hypothetical protein